MTLQEAVEKLEEAWKDEDLDWSRVFQYGLDTDTHVITLTVREK